LALVAELLLAPAGPLARVLAWKPVRSVGRISYGLYLWHLPLFLILDGPRTGLSSWSLLAVRFAATFAAALVSYFLVERPALRLKRRFERVRDGARSGPTSGGESGAASGPGVTVRP
jgi:peptidoglycan/LPS O-acetylase OafA/YrhL